MLIWASIALALGALAYVNYGEVPLPVYTKLVLAHFVDGECVICTPDMHVQLWTGSLGGT